MRKHITPSPVSGIAATLTLILPGASLVSDPVTLPVSALSQVAVSVYLPQATPLQTFHWDGRQTGWIVAGDQTQATVLSTTEHSATTARPLLSGIQVETGQPARAVAVIGDSITDGATASQDQDTRWPDFLAEPDASRLFGGSAAGYTDYPRYTAPDVQTPTMERAAP